MWRQHEITDGKTTNRSQGGAVHLGESIFAALTRQEIADLLDILFTALPSNLYRQVLEQLPTDTRQTLEQILSPPVAADEIKDEIKKVTDTPVSLA